MSPKIDQLKEMRECADQIMRRVGERVRSEVERPTAFQIMHKEAAEIVTEVDIWAEAEIVKVLSEKYPDHIIIGEESASALVRSSGKPLEEHGARGFVWIIDPIDGTTNFAKGIPVVSISVGLLYDGERVLGLVYDPIRSEMFTAIKGDGAYCNDRQIVVSAQNDLARSVVATGFPYDHVAKWDRYKPAYEAYFLAVRDIRRFGSAAIDQCWVACGRFDAFFEYSLRPWDVAAGSLIVEEAGGMSGNVSEPIGATFSIYANSFLFAPPQLFHTLLTLGQAAHVEDVE